MQTEVLYSPAAAVCVVRLDAGEQVRAEAGAMVAMDPGIEVETKATGGLLKSLGRSILGGESFFQNTFKANQAGNVVFAPSLAGDVVVHQLNGELVVQSGSYLASSASINVDSKWGGAKSFFGGEGLIMLRCSGQGTLILSSYGAIHKYTLGEGQRMTVDTGHLVAFSSSMSYEIRKFGGWKSTILGGEGFVVDCQGPGDLYIQSRSPEAFLGWLIPRLPQKGNS